jgi:hypothetical protein
MVVSFFIAMGVLFLLAAVCGLARRMDGAPSADE